MNHLAIILDLADAAVKLNRTELHLFIMKIARKLSYVDLETFLLELEIEEAKKL